MYDYDQLKLTLVDMVDVSVNELLLIDEEEDPLRVKKLLDVVEKCQVCCLWIDMYLTASEQLKEFLKAILDYYLNSLARILIDSQ